MDSYSKSKLFKGKNIGVYKNEVDSKMYLYGPVGDLFGEDCITAKGVKEALKDFDSNSIDVHIHSYGGDAFEGIAVYNIVPVSPMDCVKVLSVVLPANKYFSYLQYEKMIQMIFLFLLFLGFFGNIFGNITYGVIQLLGHLFFIL